MTDKNCPICGHDLTKAAELLGDSASAMRIHLSTHLSDILLDFSDFLFKADLNFWDQDLNDKEKSDFKLEIRFLKEKYRGIRIAYDTK